LSNPAAPAPESIPISALQHWQFCPRQCALIHVERLWAENRLTAEGRVLHARPDSGRPESRPGLRILRAVEIASTACGIHGVADVVELTGRPPRPFPVEYKRGRPKPHRADEVQLCAQALCLEEMFSCTIPEGALFYGQSRRRKPVAFDDELRALTLSVIAAVQEMFASGYLPPPTYESRRCNTCSLNALCRPKLRKSAARWLERAISLEAPP